MKSQDPTAAAAAAMATMAVGGIQPTDPRIQPFMRMAKEEWMNIQIQVLVSNGISESIARQRIERSMPTDRYYFFGQALMKYIASFSGKATSSPCAVTKLENQNGQNNHIQVPSVFPSVHQPFSGTLSQVPLISANSVAGAQNTNSNPTQTLTTSSEMDCDQACQNVSSNLNLSSLQRLFKKSPSKNTCATTTSNNTLNLLATARPTSCSSKSTRFDVSLEAPANQSSGVIPVTSSSSVTQTKPFTGNTFQHLDEALQQWTYCVYSFHHTPPAGISEKTWRSSLFKFVNFYVTLARQAVAMQQSNSLIWRSSNFVAPLFPSWLTSCCIPTVEQVLAPRTFQEAYPFQLGFSGSSMESSSLYNKGFFTTISQVSPVPPACRSSDCVPPPSGPEPQSSTSGDYVEPRRLNNVVELSPVSSLDVSSDHLSEDDVAVKVKRTSLCNTATNASNRRRSYSRCSSSMRDSSESSAERRDFPVVISPDAINKRSASQLFGKFNQKCSYPLPKNGRSVVYKKKNIQELVDQLKKNSPSTTNWIPIEKRQKKGFLAKNKAFSSMVCKTKKDMLVYIVEEQKKREERSRRFLNQNLNSCGDSHDAELDISGNPSVVSSEGLKLMTWQEKLTMLNSVERIVGKSQVLEKQYLRLCGPPDPALVRPEKVLIDSFHHCLEKWEREKDYRFIEEQFRSIRQDVTVQGIKNSFTITVYETNAKIALQNHDLGQFHQCQTQLYELYKQLCVDIKAREEFLCYRILYLVLTNMNHDLLKLSGELTAEEKQLPGIRFAEHCRRALVEGNCHRFFRLAQIGPFLTPTLIAIFLNKLRIIYLVLLSRSHYEISLNFLQKELQFFSLSECRDFLRENNAVWVQGSEILIDGRKSAPYFEASPLLQNKKMNAMG